MAEESNITYLKNSEIDKTKWDECLQSVKNGLIYGYSFYLDRMADNWDALILDDYKAVMPLTWRRKIGVRYLYQPFLTAQLGVFGENINTDILNQFLDAIPPSFKYWDIYLNPANNYSIPGYDLYQRSNYTLDLSKPYDVLYQQFNENIRRNIKRAYQSGCRLQKDIPINDVIDLAWRQMNTHGKDENLNRNRFENLYQYLYQNGNAITYAILNDTGKLMASAVFFFSHNRAYYILVGNDPNGKTLGASHALIDGFIKDHAGRDLILDFEGSDIPSLAFFYSSFGSTREYYPGLRLNRLPFYLRWLKS